MVEGRHDDDGRLKRLSQRASHVVGGMIEVDGVLPLENFGSCHYLGEAKSFKLLSAVQKERLILLLNVLEYIYRTRLFMMEVGQ